MKQLVDGCIVFAHTCGCIMSACFLLLFVYFPSQNTKFFNVWNIFHCYLILLLLFITKIPNEGNVYNFVNDLIKNIWSKEKISKSGEGWKIKLRKSYMRKDKEL